MLTQKMLTGAWMLANERTHKVCYEAAQVSEKTFYRWLHREDFQAAVSLLKEQRPIQAAVTEAHEADLNSARNDELQAVAAQREIVSELSALAIDFLKSLRREGVEALSPRQFPSIIKSLNDSIASLQNSNDRLIGLEGLIADVEALEEQVQQKLESADEP